MSLHDLYVVSPYLSVAGIAILVITTVIFPDQLATTRAGAESKTPDDDGAQAAPEVNPENTPNDAPEPEDGQRNNHQRNKT